MPRPSDISAEYKGEWIVTERDFSLSYGKEKYAWTIEAEAPAMRYYVDNPDDYHLGIADWIDDADPISFGADKTAASLKSTAMSPLNTALEVSRVTYHKIPQNSPPWADDGVPTVGSIVGGLVARMVIGYAVGAGTRKAIEYAAARKKARDGAKGKKPKKPPMPGWPAINFRRGKKGKGASATKKAANSVSVEAIVDSEESLASFEMLDGSIKELKAQGLSVALKIGGKRVWSTEALFIPIESGTKVPGWAYTMAYSAALSRELVSYYNEFVVEKPEPATKQLGFGLFET